MSATPYRIALISMPFARLSMPSLALTQMEAVLKKRFGATVEVSVHYLNLDFSEYLGDRDLYEHCLSGDALLSGIGDWFFRSAAFPDVEDNAEEYYRRFYHARDEETQTLKHRLEEKRSGLNAFLDSLIDRYSLGGVDLVGFTTLFSQTVASFAMAQRIKMKAPEVLTVIGGAACEAEMGLEISEHVPQVDVVFSGPGLKNFPTFIGYLMEGEGKAWEPIQGVFTHDHRAYWREKNDNTGLLLLGEDSDINDLIPLDYSGFLDQLDARFPGGEVAPVLLFETSRGCWWAERSVCSFCGLNGLQMKHRALSPENAIKHLESLYQYVPRCRIFMCVDTILPKRYVRDVFASLSPPPEMTMYYELKVDISERQLGILVNAGVRAFQPGIESLSTDTLKLMQKGTTAFRNLMFLKSCSPHPVHLDWNLLIFSPGESESVYATTLALMPSLYHLAPPNGTFPISFARFSRYCDDPASFGLELKPQDYYGLTYPFDEASIENLAYHFIDSKADTACVDSWLQRMNAAYQPRNAASAFATM